MTEQQLAAVKQMLGVLQHWDMHGGVHQPTEEAITTLQSLINEQALAQPKAEQEPKREPLSTEEAEALWPFDHFRSEAVRLVRKTEAKHGITKDLA